MVKRTYKFSTASVDYYFEGQLSQLGKIVDKTHAVIITDENIFKAHGNKLKNWNTIVLKAGEEFKIQPTVDTIVEQLIELGADRKSTLVGIGGGVITDLTGYVASVYMRGIKFGFVPTTVLALVDASIGGKNGIDVGVFKNMVGVIRQPSFLLHDMSLLSSLPQSEWENGFAEIIKHACIKDAAMFKELEAHTLADYQKKKILMAALIKRNALIKTKVVQADEFESGDRKLLNYGHTLGHAIENMYELSHGQAISIGMTYACHISEQLTGFKQTQKVVSLLSKYGLPTYAEFDKKKAFEILQKDKKKVKAEMSYVLLNKIGKGVVKNIPLTQLKTIIESL
ncbi:3-dehydroquinate synthase [Lacibacter sp.]|uniref:3-dehydroquinate synthase n=1 Tax=Lacibacter sp. TaxID=1915409 RepID=UPI002B4B118B|nr:3-dehydroquinate synthase [Lacibacter sp.]HLP37282.1 3-dehydroquinate synthase [Lacibacter sp.]